MLSVSTVWSMDRYAVSNRCYFNPQKYMTSHPSRQQSSLKDIPIYVSHLSNSLLILSV